MTRLLDIPETLLARLHAELAAGGDPEPPGAVRASLGVGTTEADVDALVAALHEVVVPLSAAAELSRTSTAAGWGGWREHFRRKSSAGDCP